LKQIENSIEIKRRDKKENKYLLRLAVTLAGIKWVNDLSGYEMFIRP
jgi:hypothetical protein